MKDKLTLDDCLKLYEEEGIMGLVDRVKEISFKKGTREVVKWFMANGYSGGPISYSDGIKARFDPDWAKLQAQLKKWGIK